jgi:hypothetical protein
MHLNKSEIVSNITRAASALFLLESCNGRVEFSLEFCFLPSCLQVLGLAHLLY